MNGEAEIVQPQTPSFTRWERWFLPVLFCVALGLRVLYLTEIDSHPLFEHPRLDALFHDTWARSIASGNVLGDAVFFRAPLYPYALALVYGIFGHSFVIPRILQHVTGALLVLILYLLARKLFNSRSAAVLSSLLMTFYAVLIYFEGELLFESVLLFLCVSWCLVVLKSIESGKPWCGGGSVLVSSMALCVQRVPPFLR
jgi:4-amino-4-deoxy-L-arabinose transferase-like glycosyltransferase